MSEELNPSAIPISITNNNNPDTPSSSNKTSYNKPQPYSDQKHLRGGRKASGQTTKRDTHFICFPLVTDHSIPQLAASLAQFRRVTAITPDVVAKRRRQQRQQQQQQQQKDVNGDETPERKRDDDNDEGNEDNNHDEPEEELKILPAVVHRPPGTFHLTIGTMDLSEKSEKERAVRVLKGLDLKGMLGDVEREVGFHRVLKDDDEKKKTKKTMKSEKGDELRSLTRPISPPLPPPPPPAATLVSSELALPSSTSTASSPSPSPPPSSPITISLSGLSTFPGPQHARVFYAPPIDPSHRLLSLANKIRAVFKAEGFVTETRKLTLHATVANMRYANNNNNNNNNNNGSSNNTQGRGGWKERRGGGGRSRRVGEVDGRRIVEWFGGADGTTRQGSFAKEGEKRGKASSSFVWAEGIVVDRVRICKMGAEKSQDQVLGMVYPPIRIGEKEEEEEAQVWF